MITRTYLSIGDVLSLLRQEFPDITISKIRFLESQGLVDPERSPSGYRKFYDHDVERLRWVLRQQREHFLPLKVIRDRLARSPDISTDMEDFDHAEESEPEGFDEPSEETFEEEDQSASFGSARDEDEEPNVPAHAGARPEIGNQGLGSANPETAGPRGGDDPRAAWESRSAEARMGSFAVKPSALAPKPQSVRSAPMATTPDPSVTPPVPSASSVGSEPGPSSDAPPAQAPPPRASSTSPVSAPNVTGASLTLEELCGASGLSAAEVASLEGFGLIEPLAVGGELYYDEEALTVAKLAADFARYGIEPRHLRLFRNAADRELGLIEQVVTPMLRQRNPEARQRAIDAAADLSRLGQALRSAILRRALQHHVGG